jgi:hypothetical protein
VGTHLGQFLGDGGDQRLVHNGGVVAPTLGGFGGMVQWSSSTETGLGGGGVMSSFSESGRGASGQLVEAWQ